MKLAQKLLARLTGAPGNGNGSHGNPEQEAARAAALLDGLSPAAFVNLAYRLLLGRAADPAGFDTFVPQLAGGQLGRADFLQILAGSPEFRSRGRLLDALHRSRVEITKQLPRAGVIVDLGGTCLGRPEGALVVLGYPYKFTSLSIIELPPDERHEIYHDKAVRHSGDVPTPLGPVRYVYTSMTDLSAFADGTVDLVYSGQSVEHVTREEAHQVCREAQRVLKAGGHFCLDTPNRAVTKLECPTSWINPDHKHEYTHGQLSGLLREHGFAVREAKGLCLAPESVEQGRWVEGDCARHEGVYDDIERGYLLYYRCQKV